VNWELPSAHAGPDWRRGHRGRSGPLSL